MTTWSKLMLSAVLGLVPTALLAEFAAIEGTVVTQEGTPVPGYPVIIKGPDSQTVVLTSPAGEYSAHHLPPGEYEAVPANELGETRGFSIEPSPSGNCLFFCPPPADVKVDPITIPQNWNMRE